ncbi:MAG: hypothetical protein P8X57_07390, partial [Cyclobacteriaceae bacterium]
MKKLLIIATLVAGAYSAQAQLKVGPHLSFPTGNANDVFSLVWGGDVYYMFASPNSFLNIGGASGYLNFVGDDVDNVQGVKYDNTGIIPLAVAGRATLFSTLTAGADVGFGLALDNDFDGG